MEGKVLLLSQRQVSNLVAYCVAYELEDTIAAVTGAERIDVADMPGLEFSRRMYRLARLATGSMRAARRLAPAPRRHVVLDRDYDLFFPVFSHIYELYALATVPNWRTRSRKACCFITEAWVGMLPDYLLELMSGFDHIFLGSRYAVDEVARLTGRPCSYLPIGVDVVRFAPAPRQPRPIYISNIGRRSAVTHQALLAETERLGAFYYYDTVAASGADAKERTFKVQDAGEHRRMLATILKHSNFMIAHRSYVNRPEFTGGRQELSARFYEGAAAGAVMIGVAPESDEFRRQFDWTDALIDVPFDAPDIGRILADLDADPARMAAVRSANVREAARRHDWLHRIQRVFATLGIAPTEGMRERALRLEAIAAAT